MAVSDVMDRHSLSERRAYELVDLLRPVFEYQKQDQGDDALRKRALGTRRPSLAPDRANQRWALDFVLDAFEDNTRFHVLCIADNCRREALSTVTDRSLAGARLMRDLDDLIYRGGQPDMIVSDNGMEMSYYAVPRLCQDTGVCWHYIAPGRTIPTVPTGLPRLRIARAPLRTPNLQIKLDTP